jgi:CRP/FNR family transcriptional regulator
MAAVRPEELPASSRVVAGARRLRRGEKLHHAGATFNALHTVRSGMLMSSLTLEDGRNQVVGFALAGEVPGLDAIATRTHAAEVVALVESEVCVIPYARLKEGRLQRELQRIMSRELVRQQNLMTLLGTMNAEERVAAFLVDLVQRRASVGEAPDRIVLCMTRRHVASYLGMMPETVSRLLSRLRDRGLIAVDHRRVRILAPSRLRDATRAAGAGAA